MLPSPQAQGVTGRIWSPAGTRTVTRTTCHLKSNPTLHQIIKKHRSQDLAEGKLCSSASINSVSVAYTTSAFRRKTFIFFWQFIQFLFMTVFHQYDYCIYMLVRLSQHSLFWSLTELPESVACSSLQIHKYFHYDVFKYFFFTPCLLGTQ